MDLVDEENRVLVLLDLLHHLLQALFEIAAVARSGEQRAHVERKDGGVGEHFGHGAVDDLVREPFGDRRLADAGFANQQRIVLLAPAEHLDRALHLGLATDQRIDLAVLRLLVEVDAISIESSFLFLLVRTIFRILGVARFVVVFGAARRLGGIGHARPLGDAVADVIDRVVARHVLLLQEEGGMAFALGENRDEHIGAGHLFAPRRLNVNHGALDDALEAGGRLGFLARLDDEVLQLRINVLRQILAQNIEIDAAGAQHRGGVGVVDQG